jgi:hypothetical protein
MRDGRLRRDEELRARVTLTIEAVGLRHEIDEETELG